MMAESRQQIVENYNMGFITLYEYYCQLIDTYTWVNGKRWMWHLMCLLPSWPFNLYERTVAFLCRKRESKYDNTEHSGSFLAVMWPPSDR